MSCPRKQKDTVFGCCCKCVHQVELAKHPSNTTPSFKGSILERAAYGCNVFYEMNNSSFFMNGKLGESAIIIMENKHGECEMFNQINNE